MAYVCPSLPVRLPDVSLHFRELRKNKFLPPAATLYLKLAVVLVLGEANLPARLKAERPRVS